MRECWIRKFCAYGCNETLSAAGHKMSTSTLAMTIPGAALGPRSRAVYTAGRARHRARLARARKVNCAAMGSARASIRSVHKARRTRWPVAVLEAAHEDGGLLVLLCGAARALQEAKHLLCKQRHAVSKAQRLSLYRLLLLPPAPCQLSFSRSPSLHRSHFSKNGVRTPTKP